MNNTFDMRRMKSKTDTPHIKRISTTLASDAFSNIPMSPESPQPPLSPNIKRIRTRLGTAESKQRSSIGKTYVHSSLDFGDLNRTA